MSKPDRIERRSWPQAVESLPGQATLPGMEREPTQAELDAIEAEADRALAGDAPAVEIERTQTEVTSADLVGLRRVDVNRPTRGDYTDPEGTGESCLPRAREARARVEYPGWRLERRRATIAAHAQCRLIHVNALQERVAINVRKIRTADAFVNTLLTLTANRRAGTLNESAYAQGVEYLVGLVGGNISKRTEPFTGDEVQSIVNRKVPTSHKRRIGEAITNFYADLAAPVHRKRYQQRKAAAQAKREA